MVSSGTAELLEHGVAVLPGVFPKDLLLRLRASAEACFSAIESGAVPATGAGYRFTPFSYSVLVAALLEFGASREEIAGPARSVNGEVVNGMLPETAVCHLDESWVRKRFAPSHAPRHYQPNRWHQDGGLGVSFPADPEAMAPMTQLLTCWVPLHDCGKHCPGLEFVRHRLDRLLHYTELEDLSLRRRFAPEQFWAPELEFGDGLLFLAGSLHRTYTRPEMRQDRLSLEYRFFPGNVGC
jgi:hypothetical protein